MSQYFASRITRICRGDQYVHLVSPTLVGGKPTGCPRLPPYMPERHLTQSQTIQGSPSAPPAALLAYLLHTKILTFLQNPQNYQRGSEKSFASRKDEVSMYPRRMHEPGCKQLPQPQQRPGVSANWTPADNEMVPQYATSTPWNSFLRLPRPRVA